MLPWLLITGKAKSVSRVYARLCYCSSPPGELLKFLLSPFKGVISIVRISCQPVWICYWVPGYWLLPATHTILCRNTGKARDSLCFILRLVSQRYKTQGFLSIKTKTRVTYWLSYNLPSGLCTFPTTQSGAAVAIWQKAAFTPSLSRKDGAGTSFCHESR